MLAHVFARKVTDRIKLTSFLNLPLPNFDEDSQRPTGAERRATECLVRARSTVDFRAQVDVVHVDAAAAAAELAMYRMQLRGCVTYAGVT